MNRHARAALRTSALVLTASLGLTACAGDTVRAGAAAVVAGDRIPTTRLADLTTEALADPTAKQRFGADAATSQEFERQLLARVVNRRLVQALAAEKGVSVTEGQVDERIASLVEQAGGRDQLDQQAAQNGVAPAEVRPFVRDLVLRDALADALTADITVTPTQLKSAYDAGIAQFDQVHVAHILVPDKKTADAVLAQVKADPASFAGLAAKLSTDTSNKDQGGDLGFAGRGQFVKPFEDAIFAAKPGDVLEVQTQFGFHVVRVIERRTVGLAEATPQLRRTILDQERRDALAAALTETAKRVGVQISPRFGRYVAADGTIVEAARPAISPAPAEPGLGVPTAAPAQPQG